MVLPTLIGPEHDIVLDMPHAHGLQHFGGGLVVSALSYCPFHPELNKRFLSEPLGFGYRQPQKH